MKVNYKEYVVIGNAGEEQQVITLSDFTFKSTKQEYDTIVNSFVVEVASFPMCNEFQKMLRDDPDDALKVIENQKCVVTAFRDLNYEVWKTTVKMVKIVEE